MWTEWRVMGKPSCHDLREQGPARSNPRSGLLLNQGDGVLHPPEHTLFTATEPFALGGRQAACIQFPFPQDRELHLPRQCRMGHNVLRFGEEGPGVLQGRFDVEFIVPSWSLERRGDDWCLSECHLLCPLGIKLPSSGGYHGFALDR